jgi:hypothetical protein
MYLTALQTIKFQLSQDQRNIIYIQHYLHTYIHMYVCMYVTANY